MIWTKKMESFWLGDVFKQAADYVKWTHCGETRFKVESLPSDRVVGDSRGRLHSWHLSVSDDNAAWKFVTISDGTHSDYEVEGWKTLSLSLEQFYCLWHKQLGHTNRFILVNKTERGTYRLRIGEVYNESDY